VLAFGLLAAFATATRADEAALKIVDKAIAAHGGPDVLAKVKGGYSKSRGKLELAGGIDITQEVYFAIPDKFKELAELDFMGQKINTEAICNGDKFMVRANGQEVPLTDAMKKAMQEAREALGAARLVKLKDKEYTLATLGEAQVEGKPALGIKVSKKGQKDIDLFFDKTSHLLVKVERKATDAMSGDEVSEERIITEYKKNANGIPEVKKVLIKRNGVKFLELEVLEAKTFEVVDENLFTIP
jgi:hypothetical protein